MKLDFWNKHIVESWASRQILLETIAKTADDFFDGNWEYDSVWTKISFLSLNMEDITATPSYFDSGLFYLQSVVNNLPWVDLDRLLVVLLALDKSGASNKNAKSVLDLKSIDIDFGNNAKQTFGIEKALGQELVTLYGRLKESFGWYGPALLLSSPQSAGITSNQANTGTSIFDHKTPVAMRAVAQTAAAGDTERSADAYTFLTKFVVAKKSLGQLGLQEKLMVCAALHCVFNNFLLLEESQVVFLLEHCLVWALSYNVPVEVWVARYLAGQTEASEYVQASGTIAQIMRRNANPLFENTKTLSVGNFIEHFTNESVAKEIDPVVMNSYCNTLAKKENLSAEQEVTMQKVLFLAIHLRECDFIDYRGLLLESKAEEPTFNWKILLQSDIDSFVLGQIQFYFTIVKRPILMRIFILASIEGLEWGEAPVLNNLLLVSDVYTDVYGDSFGPLLFMDEKSSQLVLNKDIQSTWARDDMQNWIQLDQKANQEVPDLF